MLDTKSLDVIARFKQAVAESLLPSQNAYSLATNNRGNKLQPQSVHPLKPKVVEYEGTSHLVLTNEPIANTTARNKRKWSDFYRDNTKKAKIPELEQEILESESESLDEENPFDDLRLTELLSPLVHPSELVSHPAILKTYTLTVLDKFAGELIDLIEIEQNNLNWLNKLLQILNGEDWFYLLEEQLGLESYDHGLVEKEKEDSVAGKSDENSDKRVTRNGNGTGDVTDPFFALPKTLEKYEQQQSKALVDENDELSTVQEDLINYLQVGIQRQNEYIKLLTQIRNGIIKVDKYRQDLYKWGKEMYDKK